MMTGIHNDGSRAQGRLRSWPHSWNHLVRTMTYGNVRQLRNEDNLKIFKFIYCKVRTPFLAGDQRTRAMHRAVVGLAVAV